MKRAQQYVLAAALAGLMATSCNAAQPATSRFPTKTVRLIVAFSAGSQTDLLSRMIGQKLSEKWGEQVVIDNRSSGGGIVASQLVGASVPDGHTLFAHSSGYAINPWLYPEQKLDMLRDFRAVSLLASTPQIMVVAPALGPRTLKELVAFARQKGDQFIVAVPQIASSSHLLTEKFYFEAGIKGTNVWFKGTPECATDTIAMRTHMSFLPLAPLVPFVRDGRLLGLAMSSKERSPTLPDVPTVSEALIPGFDYESWFVVSAPAQTPRAVVHKISEDIRAILNSPDVKARLATIGATPRPMTPDDAQAFVKSEIQSLGKIIKAAGVKVE